MNMIRVGIQGSHGTFSEIAAVKYFGKEGAERIGCASFVEIMDKLDNRELDYAVLPVENTTTGIIARTYDLFKYHDVHAVGEVLVPIRENLIVLPGTKLAEIHRVYSHPEALSQCANFFASHPEMEPVSYQDTAESVAYVRAQGSHANAALASYLAGEYYGMTSLMENVNDNLQNTTRFLVVTWRQESHPEADKTSLMLVCRHEPGSLYRALSVLADAGINMLKLESRPMPGRMFEYLFYVDIEGSAEDPRIHEALEKMKQHCVQLRNFGSYRAAHLPE
jgi:chorismate mutase/prephenate dehydratase